MADTDKHITYSLADIQRYLGGSMNAKEMHELERAALEDPFLADALEGYSDADLRQSQQHLTQIETALLSQNEQYKVIALPPQSKSRNWQVAAAVVLLISVAGITYFITGTKNNQEPLAKAATENAAPVATDSSQLQAPIAASPTESTPLAQTKPVDEKGTAIVPESNTGKRNKVLRKPTTEAPVVMAPITKDSDNAGMSALSSMAKKDAAVAGAMADTQKTMSDEAFSSNGELVMPGAYSKDTNQSKRFYEKKATAGVASYNITGTVVDQNQHPVPHASVMLKGRTEGITTDAEGNFRLPTTDSTVLAVVSAIGYATMEKRLKKAGNKVVLSESDDALSEVVTTSAFGMQRQKRTDTTVTSPQGGWQSFREYVKDKLRKRYDSTMFYDNDYFDSDLSLEFSVNKSGEPYDFKVLRTPDTLVANEAIKAIIEGPKWINRGKNRKKRVTVKL